jgi:hypothetical protein
MAGVQSIWMAFLFGCQGASPLTAALLMTLVWVVWKSATALLCGVMLAKPASMAAGN